jgi:hypothetical protein
MYVIDCHEVQRLRLAAKKSLNHPNAAGPWCCRDSQSFLIRQRRRALPSTVYQVDLHIFSIMEPELRCCSVE